MRIHRLLKADQRRIHRRGRCPGRRRSQLPAAGIALTLLAALPGCEDGSEDDLPSPPDLSGLVRAYEEPTGSVEAEDIPCLGQEALRRLGEGRLGQVRDAVVDALAALRQRLEDGGLPTETDEPADEDEPRLRGVLRIQRICRGWDPQLTTPDPDASGQIDLHALVEDRALQPVIWGEARSCLARVEVPRLPAVNLFLDATLELFLYRGLRAGGETSFLLRLQGEVGGEQDRRTVDWDFRVSTASIDLRLPARDGDVVASVAGGLVELRTAAGSFSFDPAVTTCSRPSD
jgi:hypothetical protein